MLHAQEILLKPSDTLILPELTLGEIEINASKDNLKLNQMPVSVSMIDAKEIEVNEIHSLPEITGFAPNFYMPDYGSKLTSPVYIRGIGSRIDAPSVGLYVDHVPYFEKAAFDIDFFDISQIEVLRGPQGTLFGRNTMGGLVNITTLSPLDYQGSHVKFSAGTYGDYYLNAGHYSKPGDKIGYSISGNVLHQNGFYTNAYTNNQVDEMDSYGLRSKLIWQLSHNFSIENIASFESSRQGGYPYAVFNDSTGSPEEINYNQYSSYDRDLFSDAMILKYASKKYEFLSTTSFQYLGDQQEIDQDFTPDSLFFVAQRQKQNMVSQEFIFRSKNLPKYQWLFGAFGFRQVFDKSVNIDMYASGMKLFREFDHDVSGYAFFHQSTINDLFIENLSLTGGIRIDFEHDELRYKYNTLKNDLFTNVADTLYPALDYSEWSPKASLSYYNSGRNYYLTVTRGFKTGGFNSTFERPEDLTFGPEYSWNYEAGIKTPLFDHAAYMHFAMFYIDWKNQQIYQPVPSGRGSMLKNAGHSASKGLEIMLKTKSFMGFEPMFTYGYTHATFLDHVVDSVTNYNGKYLPYVPKHTVSVLANKSFRLKESSWLEIIGLNVSYRGAGKIFWNEENENSQEFYSVVGSKLSFQRNNLKFELWGKNLLNSDYQSFYFEAIGNKYVQSGRPLQVGFNLSVNF
jgi:iron complex outermembrane recepter protein